MAQSEQERRIARIIKEYDLQGWHRSGTEVDGASARWLADRVAGCGLEPTLESVPFDRLDPGLAYVETAGCRAAGVPLFDGGLTEPEGVSGPLGALGSGSVIGVTELGAGPTTRYLDARPARHHDIARCAVGFARLAVRKAPPAVSVKRSAPRRVASYRGCGGRRRTHPAPDLTQTQRRWLLASCGGGSYSTCWFPIPTTTCATIAVVDGAPRAPRLG